MPKIVQLNRAEADALAIAIGKAPNAYERRLLSAVLRRAEVPEGKAGRNKPSAYDRWLEKR